MNIKGCIHPELIRAISLCGHGDKILIANGNYPLHSRSGSAEKIYLGVCADVPSVTQVMQVLLQQIHVEKAEVMAPDSQTQPEVFQEFSRLLNGMPLSSLGRFEFYDACGQPEVLLAIHTGETRSYANILLTVGGARSARK